MEKLLIILFNISLFFSCYSNNTKSENNISIIQYDTATIQFRIDKKLETLYIVFLFADYPLLSPYPNSYKTDALKYFDKYRNHKAVLLARDLIKKGFVADYAVNWLFQHSEFPVFRKIKSIDFPFGQRPINKDSLEFFRNELINFYTDAHCDSFFVLQNIFLEKMLSTVKDSFSRKDIIQVIENYFGIKKKAKYEVILSPLLHSGGFTIERTDKNELYALIGPGSSKDAFPEFDKTYLEQDMIIHEFSHNYANSIVEKFIAETEKFENDLFPFVKNKLQRKVIQHGKVLCMNLL